jgi:hypothetical protein
MGTEEFWIPAVMAALSTGAGAYNTIQSNQKGQASEVQGIEQQQALRQQAAGMVNKTVQNITQSNPQALQRQATGDFVSQLRNNEAATNPTLNGTAATPGADPRAATGAAASNATVQGYGNTMAGNMATMSAAVRQRQQEGLAMGTLQTGLGNTGQQSGADSFITQLRTAQASQPNPWISLASGLGNTAAKGYAMNAGGGGASSLTPVAPANAIDYYTPTNGLYGTSSPMSQ